MKISFTYNLYLICLLSLILLGVSGSMVPVYADETITADAGTIITPDPMTLMDADSAALFNLINSARENPLAMAESLGLNPKQILADLPNLKDILESGLPPLVFNDRLYKVAGDHTREMLANSYYAYESLDGRTVEQRLQDAGYVPVKSGESIGLIFFKNFISAERAVSQIFAKMFKDEVSPDWSGPRNILNPDFKDIGVGVAGGIYQFDGMKGNVYLATCDFGYRPEIYELQLLQLINQFRARPTTVAESLGVDMEEILAVFPELKPVFLAGLQPVKFNRSLYLSADAKINDMLANEYFGYASPSGITLGERIWTAGYRGQWAAETLACMSTCDSPISPSLTVSRIFRQLFFNSLRTSGYRDGNLLSEKAVDAGFCVKAAESAVLSGICGNHVHVTAGDFGYPLIKTGPVICGVVFADKNSNDIYDIGEEVTKVAVTIRTQGINGASWTVTTDEAGGYAVSVESGLYRVSVGDGDELQYKWVQMETANLWQVFKIKAETDRQQ